MDLQSVITQKYQPTFPMSTPEQKEDVLQLMRETGAAHHEAFILTKGDDEEWPMWYAQFMHTKLMDILDLSFTQSELIYVLVAADLEHQDEAPDTEWFRFYADFVVESLT